MVRTWLMNLELRPPSSDAVQVLRSLAILSTAPCLYLTVVLIMIDLDSISLPGADLLFL